MNEVSASKPAMLTTAQTTSGTCRTGPRAELAWSAAATRRTAPCSPAVDPACKPTARRTAAGAVPAVAGGVILLYPDASIVVLTSVLEVVLVVEGACLIATGFTRWRQSPPTVRLRGQDASPSSSTHV